MFGLGCWTSDLNFVHVNAKSLYIFDWRMVDERGEMSVYYV